MSRIYTVSFDNVSVSAAQDLIQIKSSAGKVFRILRRWVGATNVTLPTGQMMRLRERFLPTVVTDGSGGSTPTPVKHDPGDAAATFTAFANNTTPATTNGTAVILYTAGVHIFNGFDDIHDDPPVVGMSSGNAAQSYVFELLSTVSGTVNLSGGVEVEEMG